MATDGSDTKMDTTEGTNDDDRKLFVGGLPQDATDGDLRTYFSTFGEIETINLKVDPNTGRSRGFAFIVFKSSSAVDTIVATDEHNVKAKKVAVKRAQSRQGKVYVGKLKSDMTDEALKEFFTQYGPVASLEHPMDKVKNEARNFCFVTFEKEEHAKKLIKEGVVKFNDNELEIKRVTQKQDTRGFGRGGGAMGAGGWWPGGYENYYGWGGYGAGDYYGGWGGWGPYGPGGDMAFGGGGKTPRGGRGGANRGRGMRGMRSKPY